MPGEFFNYPPFGPGFGQQPGFGQPLGDFYPPQDPFGFSLPPPGPFGGQPVGFPDNGFFNGFDPRRPRNKRLDSNNSRDESIHLVQRRKTNGKLTISLCYSMAKSF